MRDHYEFWWINYVYAINNVHTHGTIYRVKPIFISFLALESVTRLVFWVGVDTHTHINRPNLSPYPRFDFHSGKCASCSLIVMIFVYVSGIKLSSLMSSNKMAHHLNLNRLKHRTSTHKSAPITVILPLENYSTHFRDFAFTMQIVEFIQQLQPKRLGSACVCVCYLTPTTNWHFLIKHFSTCERTQTPWNHWMIPWCLWTPEP